MKGMAGRQPAEALQGRRHLSRWQEGRSELHPSGLPKPDYQGVSGADERLDAALDLQAQHLKILEAEPQDDMFMRWKPRHQQAIGWDPDINDGVRLNIRPFLNAQLRKGGKAGAGILRAKPGTIKWSKDRCKYPTCSKEEFPWFWGWGWGWDENDHTLATDFWCSDSRGSASRRKLRWHPLERPALQPGGQGSRHAAAAGPSHE